MFYQLRAVMQKEFAGYFRTPTAYIIIAVYLVLSMFATFYSAYFFAYDNSGLISFFTYQPEIFVVLMPAATMQSSTRVSTTNTAATHLVQRASLAVVLGKFMAAAAFGLLMLALTLPFALYASTLVDLDMLNVLSAYLATVLAIALLTAAGCLVSVFNTNAVLAYLFSVFVGWLLVSLNFDFLLSPLLNISETISNRLSRSLNFYRNYQDMMLGQPGFDNLAYFLLLTILILWLNVAAIDYKKH